jgi:hypothetical protein
LTRDQTIPQNGEIKMSATMTKTIELPTSWYGKAPTKEQLAEILRLHRAYFRGEAEGRRADLRGADLRGANLYDANLYGANLYDADLGGANLRGANLGDETVLPAGFVWKAYIEELVPQLLTAAGKKLEEIANETIWGCHSWGRGEELACPIATAFSVHSISDVPILYREQANFFIQVFDARIVPLERVLARSKAAV